MRTKAYGRFIPCVLLSFGTFEITLRCHRQCTYTWNIIAKLMCKHQFQRHSTFQQRIIIIMFNICLYHKLRQWVLRVFIVGTDRNSESWLIFVIGASQMYYNRSSAGKMNRLYDLQWIFCPDVTRYYLKIHRHGARPAPRWAVWDRLAKPMWNRSVRLQSRPKTEREFLSRRYNTFPASSCHCKHKNILVMDKLYKVFDAG